MKRSEGKTEQANEEIPHRGIKIFIFLQNCCVQTNFNLPGSVHDGFRVFREMGMMTSPSVVLARGVNNSFLH